MSIPDDIRATAQSIMQRINLDGSPSFAFFAAPIIAEALMAERERAAKIADLWEGKPCGHAEGWTPEECDFYDAGQIDASTSIAAAIRTPDTPPATQDAG